MTAWIGATMAAAGFAVLVVVLRLVERGRAVKRVARSALGVVRNVDLSDRQKEQQLQAHSLRLFALFFALSLGGAAALAIPLALVWSLERLGWGSLDAVLGVVASVPFLATTTAVALAAAVLFPRLRRAV